MRWTVLAGTLFLCVLICSCATFQPREDIDVALVNVRLGETTVWETTAYFTVRVSNASPEPLTVNGSAYRFYLNGLNIGQGLSDERLEVPRLSSATQEVPVHLRNLSMATRIRPILESRAIDYRVDSTLYLGDSNWPRRCRVAREGRLALEDFQPALRDDARNR
jgi:LEA14-like dessication related protein